MEGKPLSVARSKVPTFQPGKFSPVVEIVIPVSAVSPTLVPLSLADKDSNSIGLTLSSDSAPPLIATPPIPAPTTLLPDVPKERLNLVRDALTSGTPLRYNAGNVKTVVQPEKLFACPRFIELAKAVLSKDAAKRFPLLPLPHEPSFCPCCIGLGRVSISEATPGALAHENPQGLIDLVHACQLFPDGPITLTFRGADPTRKPFTLGLHRHTVVPPTSRFCMLYDLDEDLVNFSSLASTLTSLILARNYDL
jgi:hypothetical protein